MFQLLRRLEAGAMFTAGWEDLQLYLFRWENCVRAGHAEVAEMPRMREAFRRYGVA